MYPHPLLPEGLRPLTPSHSVFSVLFSQGRHLLSGSGWSPQRQGCFTWGLRQLPSAPPVSSTWKPAPQGVHGTRCPRAPASPPGGKRQGAFLPQDFVRSTPLVGGGVAAVGADQGVRMALRPSPPVRGRLPAWRTGHLSRREVTHVVFLRSAALHPRKGQPAL